MTFTRLCEAVFREQARRTVRALRPARLFAVGMLVAWLASPVVAWRLAAGLGAAIGPALTDAEAARALAVGCALCAAAVGALISVGIGTPSAFGQQLAASPVSRTGLVLAAVVPVVVGGMLLAGPPLVAGGVSFASHARPVSPSLVPLGVSFLALVVVGALLAEGASAVRRRPLGGAGAFALALATGLSAERVAESSLAGDAELTAVSAAGIAAIGCAATWVLLRGRRPAVRSGRRAAATLRLTSCRRAFAVPLGAAVILARSSDLRAGLIAAIAFGVCGVVLGAASSAPVAAAVVLGGGAAALTAAIVPLAVRGRIDAGAWVWRTAGRSLVAGGWSAAALAAMLLAVAPVLAVAILRPSALGAAGYVAALTWLCWAAALVAGSLVPRRATGVGDDATSLAALLGVAFALGSVVSAVGPRLETLGLSPLPSALLLVVAAGVVGIGSIGVTWGRR